MSAAALLPVKDLEGWFPDDQAEEIRGIQRLTKIPIGQLWAMNAL